MELLLGLDLKVMNWQFNLFYKKSFTKCFQKCIYEKNYLTFFIIDISN